MKNDIMEPSVRETGVRESDVRDRDWYHEVWFQVFWYQGDCFHSLKMSKLSLNVSIISKWPKTLSHFSRALFYE